ncbi:MAG: hypothetical protein AVDCRST_MAG33-1963 [uncultured Thermomicrobiales bacterium]|uniref:Uncharacterized protein n=1 Tax=uncultured Thermomicrobiales bacterium TaxID=1645740 RepID=A0A6J4V0C0_9BACT|nr:MAG: hypothetical protein AVDCRST_MAG33-1963 [uncultured Thermomicrobiales bacterium]
MIPPIVPEQVRIVHERQVVEIVRRRRLARLAGPPAPSAFRRVVGGALVRAGRAIGDQSVPADPIVPNRPGVRIV